MAELDLRRHGVTITRVTRAGVEFSPDRSPPPVGRPSCGWAARRLSALAGNWQPGPELVPEIIPIFTGIAPGILLELAHPGAGVRR